MLTLSRCMTCDFVLLMSCKAPRMSRPEILAAQVGRNLNDKILVLAVNLLQNEIKEALHDRLG